MNRIASVLYPYSPKNDDELALQVGDKIEVIGVEEEGWWKGSLNGRLGVFPSNFVKVVEAESPTSTSQNISKLNSIFSSRVGSKNSLSSSNSLNNICNSNNNLNIHNNNTSNSNNSNNHIMNNTHPQQPPPHDIDSTNEYPFGPSADGPSHTTNPQSERRPKPLRGIGLGDIFAQSAKTKPLPADPLTRSSTTALATERFGANIASGGLDSNTLGRLSSNTLQKPIPKKPPPPAPTDNTIATNGSSSDQAPALPPKPSNQFSPLLAQRALPNPTASQHTVREQARVIYAYKPSNDDELEMQVDDIINIIDKDIEDAGWWKGELNGKIGVFPDNFVQLIGVQDGPVAQESQNSTRLSGGSASTSLSNLGGVATHHQQPAPAGSTDGKREIKSVFASTPKGFSKELESNLEKHNNAAAFLSLKRNKLHQQQLPHAGARDQPVSMTTGSSDETPGGSPGIASSLMASDANHRHNGHPASGPEPTSPGKLNHITANRAKGPTRRPPSNVMNKRNQLGELSNSHKLDPSNDTKNELSHPSSPASKQMATIPTSNSHGSLPMLPNEQRQNGPSPNVPSTPQIGSFASHSAVPKDSSQPPTLKTQPPLGNGLTDHTQPITPKSSQRASQPTLGHSADIKSKINPTSAPSTPPWMVELRKTNAEKKRDPLPAAASSLIEDIPTPSNPTQKVPSVAAPEPSAPANIPSTTSPAITTAPSPLPVSSTVAPIAKLNAPVSSKATFDENPASRSDEAFKNSFKKISNEMNELRGDVKKLQEEFQSILGLKDAIETMKIELKTCQSATESQRKYIKELVNNLADERKRIAAMQTEIDRNLS